MMNARIFYFFVVLTLGLSCKFVQKIESSEIYHPPSRVAEIAAQQLQDLSSDELDSDWRLNEFFGHIKVISNKQSLRYPRLLEKMKEVGLEETSFEISPRVIGAHLNKSLWSRVPDRINSDPKIKQGLAGCILAHYNLIKNTRDRYVRALVHYNYVKNQSSIDEVALIAAQKEVDKYSSVLIIEDNNAFGSLENNTPSLQGMGRNFRKILQQLPNDWDMFYFICMHGEYGEPPAEEVAGSPLLLKAVYGLVNKCFAIRASVYNQLVEQYEKYISSESDVELIPADHIVAQLHKSINAYIAREPLAYRLASISMVTHTSDTDIDRHWQPKPR
jgi:hypothetical protein